MPNGCTKPLRDYQQAAKNWTLSRLFANGQKGAGLFLDPGLGKTRTSLEIARTLLELREVRKVLIVAPLRTVYNVWPNEMRKWGFPYGSIILHEQHATGMARNMPVEIVNPEGLSKLQNLGRRWDLMIVDESTKFKIWSTHRMRFMRKILPLVPMRVILTGTPAANCLSDLHSQMFIVDDGESLGRNVTFFRDKFMQIKDCGKWRKWMIRDSMKDELLQLISDKVLRMDAETYLDMPELIHNDIWVDLNSEEQRQYNKLKRELFAQLQTGDIVAGSAGAAYSKCRQYANGMVYNTDPVTREQSSHIAHSKKIEAIVDLSDELQGKPLLLFYQFTHDAMRLKADKRFKDWPVIRGGMKRKDADSIIDHWNQGHYRGMLCQSQTAAHGLNLQDGGCVDVGFFGIPDNPEVYRQDYCRIYRQGVQGQHVRIHRFLCRRTVEEVQVERMANKTQTEFEFLEALQKHAAT